MKKPLLSCAFYLIAGLSPFVWAIEGSQALTAPYVFRIEEIRNALQEAHNPLGLGANRTIERNTPFSSIIQVYIGQLQELGQLELEADDGSPLFWSDRRDSSDDDNSDGFGGHSNPQTGY